MYSTGAIVISKLLMNNCMIQVIRLYTNAITKEGTCLILQSAVSNETCQVYIGIDDEYKNDDEVQKMMNTLENRRRM